MGKGIFVTAVDTEVGKTLCSCGMAEALIEAGLDVGVYKPVLSGAKEQNGRYMPEDALMLKSASGSDDDMELINPYCFLTPVTPAHAACIENVTIDKNVLMDNYNVIKERHDLTIVEGAGGVMSPVTNDYLVLDMIKDMDCGAIVVTDTALGRINHTLMTLKALTSHQIDLIGIIVNRYPKRPSMANKSLLKYIRIFNDCEILGIVPEIEDGINFYNDFIAEFKKNVDLTKLKK
jgi:dethiobiotin synthetase